jgi:DNA-binding XRE family transcriptional regulator
MNKKNEKSTPLKGYTTLDEFGRKLAQIPGMSKLIEGESANLAVADFVRDSRKAAELSQAELACEIGVTQARISQLEKGEGRYGPSVTLLARIAKACGGELHLSLK